MSAAVLALLVGALSSATDADEVELELEVIDELLLEGVELPAGALDLTRAGDGAWIVELRSPRGDHRSRTLARLPDPRPAAVATVRAVVLELMAPHPTLGLDRSVSGRPLGERLVWESLFGWGAGALGAALGYWASAAAIGCIGGPCREEDNLPAAAVVGALAMASGVALGGDLSGARSDLSKALLGAAAGIALSAGGTGVTLAVAGSGSPEFYIVSGFAMGLVTLGGSLLFYELFAEASDRSASWPLLPAVGVHGDGLGLTLGAAF